MTTRRTFVVSSKYDRLRAVLLALASYDQETGNRNTNSNCFRLPAYLKDRNARTLWPAGGEWMCHRIDDRHGAPVRIRKSSASRGEMDRQLARPLSALEPKVGSNYLLAVTADHGMPSEPSSPDHRS